jgi:ABC-type Fe3+ transport system substrate-binding protein
MSWSLSLVPLLILSLCQLSAAVYAQGAPGEWDKIVEAAKKEGNLVVSIPASAELRKTIDENFKKKFPGIELELITARGPSHAHKILQEKKAKVNHHDIHVAGTSSIIAAGFVKEGLVEPLLSWLVLPEVKEAKNWWGGHLFADKAQQYVYPFMAYLTETIWYNTDSVKPEQIVSYDDLLNPRWKGKIAILDPRTQGSGESTWSFLLRIKGEEYLKRLVAQDLIVNRDQRQIADSLAKGKALLTIGVSYYSFQPFLKVGIPLKPLPVAKEGTYASSGSGNVVVLKGAPHPNAAKVFLNWMLSREGQELYGKATGQATRRLDVDSNWTRELGVMAAKDVLTMERFREVENLSEESLEKYREPGNALAHRLLN